MYGIVPFYIKCRFYWHKHTSKHNKKLCNAAQIQKRRAENAKVVYKYLLIIILLAYFIMSFDIAKTIEQELAKIKGTSIQIVV